MLENHADQREMVLLFSLLFSRCCNEQGDHKWFFFSVWFTRWAKRRRKAALLRVFTAFALQILQERQPRRIAWVLPRPQNWFGNLLNLNALNIWRKELSGYKGNIPVYLHGCCSCYLLPLTHAHARDKSNEGLAFRCFPSKTWRDQIKSILSAFADEHLLANYPGISV